MAFASHGQSLSQRPVFAADGRRLGRTDDTLDWLPVLHQHSAQINLCVLWDANRRTCPDSSSPTVLLRKRVVGGGEKRGRLQLSFVTATITKIDMIARHLRRGESFNGCLRPPAAW